MNINKTSPKKRVLYVIPGEEDFPAISGFMSR